MRGDATGGGDDVTEVQTASMPFGIGTPAAVGSLPHTDVAEAIAFVLATTPELPAVPSLPRRDPREGMLAQAGWGVPGIIVADDGSLGVDVDGLDPDAPIAGDLDGPPFATLHAFLDVVAGRTAAIKVQTTGPVTLAGALVAAGAPAAVAREVAVRAVRARAAALADAVARVAPLAPLVAVLDEPGLVGAIPDRVGDPETVIDLVSGALAVWEGRATTGIHCCGPADWKAVLQAGPQILSAPVNAGFSPSAGALAAFLERGGWVAWGAVPTDRPLGESASHWWRDLSAQWCGLVQAGCDPVLIRRQALVTPACGLALHDLSQVERVFALTRTLGMRIHDQLAGVRLSVGA